MAHDHSTSDIKRAEGLWFSDANLVIQAEQTVFRVYASLLAHHSSIFDPPEILPAVAPSQINVSQCCSWWI
ncbi:hypothetical protein C8F01DRAFT_1145088 [Mycena amicta]|nr:hypothetical protein C8F01DRAFT_1145088 [Mycena amicta]